MQGGKPAHYRHLNILEHGEGHNKIRLKHELHKTKRKVSRRGEGGVDFVEKLDNGPGLLLVPPEQRQDLPWQRIAYKTKTWGRKSWMRRGKRY